MSNAVGFGPVVTTHAVILVLGSMPGRPSLQRQEYYGNERNSFWRIMQSLLSGTAEQNYAQNIAMLTRSRIALWDVIASCRRAGSLDSDIEDDTVITNDFSTFFAAHPNIKSVFFNGGRAHTDYRRKVLPRIAHAYPDLYYERLLSTSPANARYTFEQKLVNWSTLRRVLDATEQ